jgi:hypothetical protein
MRPASGDGEERNRGGDVLRGARAAVAGSCRETTPHIGPFGRGNDSHLATEAADHIGGSGVIGGPLEVTAGGIDRDAFAGIGECLRQTASCFRCRPAGPECDVLADARRR